MLPTFESGDQSPDPPPPMPMCPRLSEGPWPNASPLKMPLVAANILDFGKITLPPQRTIQHIETKF